MILKREKFGHVHVIFQRRMKIGLHVVTSIKANFTSSDTPNIQIVLLPENSNLS
jgi:hypothetical protein